MSLLKQIKSSSMHFKFAFDDKRTNETCGAKNLAANRLIHTKSCRNDAHTCERKGARICLATCAHLHEEHRTTRRSRRICSFVGNTRLHEAFQHVNDEDMGKGMRRD